MRCWPTPPQYKTGMNLGISPLVGTGTEEQAKAMLFDLRWCPTSPSWPSGFNWPISWDSGATQAAPFKCTSFNDESTYESPAYQAKALGEKYMLGRGWDRPGFPYAPETIKFQSNDNSRPTTFCGLSRGDEFASTAYNQEWSNFLAAAGAYLSDAAHDYTDVATYYVQNEPQNDADYQVSAFLCKLSKTAAPKLKISVSREPLPNIAERTDFKFAAGDMGPCGYDYWVAHVGRWYATYAWQRIAMNNESVLLYSLPQDVLPMFTPCADNDGLVQGVHVRVVPWVSWSVRAIGWEYYNMGFFMDASQSPPVPGVAAVLFRESYEDYEYLRLANAGVTPRPYVDEVADRVARSVGMCNFAWTQDVELIHAIRRELGFYIEGTRASLPTSTYTVHSFAGGPYYIDFCDPADTRIPTPLVDTNLGGHTWTKVGWAQFNPAVGYGWCGRYTSNPVIDKYATSNNGGDWVQRTYIYDDYQNRTCLRLVVCLSKSRLLKCSMTFTFRCKMASTTLPWASASRARLAATGHTWRSMANHCCHAHMKSSQASLCAASVCSLQTASFVLVGARIPRRFVVPTAPIP